MTACVGMTFRDTWAPQDDGAGFGCAAEGEARRDTRLRHRPCEYRRSSGHSAAFRGPGGYGMFRAGRCVNTAAGDETTACRPE